MFKRIWRLEGTIDRRTYVLSGAIAFALKYAIDFSIARLFGQPWSPIRYWHFATPAPAAAPNAPQMFVTMLIAALPFIWFGVALTLLRLADVGWHPALAALFFVPVLNLGLFLLLSVMPSRAARPDEAPRARHSSATAVEVAILSVLATAAIGVACAAVSIWLFRSYGLTLFVGLPFCIGFVAAWIQGSRYPSSKLRLFTVASVATLFFAGALLAMAWEGIICIVMAAPIGIVLAMLGAAFGCLLQNRGRRLTGATMMALLPVLATVEGTHRQPAPLYEVATSVDIDAPPQKVWSNVIGFRDITAKPEWYFRLGLSHPLRATIDGRGVGAMRHCVFTTGAFEEPVTTWDEPRVLAFNVAKNPPPMRELTPFAGVDPPHLHGFLVSERGRFDLVPLPGGRTRLIGTTVYKHSLWPAGYWRLWSDAIIHRIHLRVLRHIKGLSETSYDSMSAARPVRSGNS